MCAFYLHACMCTICIETRSGHQAPGTAVTDSYELPDSGAKPRPSARKIVFLTTEPSV